MFPPFMCSKIAPSVLLRTRADGIENLPLHIKAIGKNDGKTSNQKAPLFWHTHYQYCNTTQTDCLVSISAVWQFSLPPSGSQPASQSLLLLLLLLLLQRPPQEGPLFSTLIGYFTDCLSLRCSISSPSDVITMAPIRPDINYLQYGQGVVGRLSPVLAHPAAFSPCQTLYTGMSFPWSTHSFPVFSSLLP